MEGAMTTNKMGEIITASKLENGTAAAAAAHVVDDETTTATKTAAIYKKSKLPLLILNIALMSVGMGGPLLTKIYFNHGGRRVWFSSLIQVVGWPMSFIPLYFSYLSRRRRSCNGTRGETKLVFVTPRLTAVCSVLGVMTALICYLYSNGSSKLPVSTSNLLISTQLAFTALISYFVVKQKFTPFSINAVFLLILGAAILGLQSNGDRPEGVTTSMYYVGFLMTLGAAALYGLVLPLTELTYSKIKSQEITYTLVMEMQMLMVFFGSIFCLVGMAVNGDFQELGREAREFGLGMPKYVAVNFMAAVLWQFFNLGFVGVVACSSSLLAGVVMAVLLPVGQVMAVILLREKFNSGKGISLALSLWGFLSYLYGERAQAKAASKQRRQQQMSSAGGKGDSDSTAVKNGLLSSSKEKLSKGGEVEMPVVKK